MPNIGRFSWEAVRSSGWAWVGIVALLILFVGLMAAPAATDFIVNRVYKNVAEPLDKELPVTVTSFRSGSNVVSSIGGMGEGVNCSMPKGFDFLFDRQQKSARTYIPVRQRFRQACVFHDLCYRHGLATYGYTQNDCDELLQEQALRICISVSPQKTLNDCQTDAKKVAAGVKYGGFKWFKSWDESTYFEFDPNPYRSIRFFSVRAVEHPFKPKFPDLLKNDPDQLLVMFSILRSGVRSTCINCADRDIRPEEFAYAGTTPPSDYKKKMNDEINFWIPPGRLWSAPHIAADGSGQSMLVWLARESIENSNSCVIVADPKKLFTDTRPERAGCGRGLNKYLGLGQIDLRSSALQLSIVANALPADATALPSIVATGLTAQRGPALQVCVSGDMRNGWGRDDAACHSLMDATGKTIDGIRRWGAFQNFPIVRGERHLLLARGMGNGENGDGVDVVNALAFDIARPHFAGAGHNTASITLALDKKISASDDYDPMVPVALSPSDQRLMAMTASRTLNLHEIDLASSKPEPVKLRIEAGDERREVILDKSWAHRPLLVTEIGSGQAERKTQLVLSRSTTARTDAEQSKEALDQQSKSGGAHPRDEVRIEFIVLERPLAATAPPAPYKLVSALACRVTYTLTDPKGDWIERCRRTIDMVSSRRATPATLLQGAQLLVGKFKGDRTGLALFDRCYPRKPIFVQPLAIGDASAPAEGEKATSKYLERTHSCSPLPLGGVGGLASAM